jgi:hypothetical protein
MGTTSFPTQLRITPSIGSYRCKSAPYHAILNPRLIKQNVVLVIANGTGTVLVLEGWTDAAEKVHGGGTLSDVEVRNLGRYLYKLQLDPDWDVQLAQLGVLWNQTNPPRASPRLILDLLTK